MKNLSYFIFCAVLLLSACKKSGLVDDTGDVNTSGGATITRPELLTYSQINGDYILIDSIHYIGGVMQFIYPDSTHPINKRIHIAIDSPTASFLYEGRTYRETGAVRNEFACADKYYNENFVRFDKDSVLINYHKYIYKDSLALSITFKGYKVK